MNQYVVYHNRAKQGTLTSVEGAFIARSKRSSSHSLGKRIWLISGEGQSTPKSYFLQLTFVPEESMQEGEWNVLRGRWGTFFRPPVQLDFLPWFAEFFRSQANFSLGLNPIGESYLPQFERMLQSLGSHSN